VEAVETNSADFCERKLVALGACSVNNASTPLVDSARVQRITTSAVRSLSSSSKLALWAASRFISTVR
jgi:hypothetical protein